MKVPKYVLAALAVTSAVVLLGPDTFLQSLGLSEVRSAYRPWIGAAFLLSSLLFLSAVIGGVGRTLAPLVRDAWNTRQLRKELHHLSPPEAAILAHFLEEDTTTYAFPLSDGVVNGLVAKRILYRASQFGHPGSTYFDYNLQPWAWRYLLQHRKLVQRPDRAALEPSRAG